MTNVYEAIGVKPIVNATGVFTRLGGALMPPAVTQAMAEAAKQGVCMEELQYRAGQVIAQITGAEAAYVVSGAQAGIVVSIAACIAGLDPAKMDQLPDTTGLKHEVIMPKAHRNHYDHAVEAAGGKIIEVGSEDGCRPAQLEAAINERTAAIFVLPDWPQGNLSLEAAVQVGQKRQIPVVVDGAGRLDQPENLRRYVASGADLVIFSGGKFIRGPQASGFVCGCRVLISSIAWQHLDMDVTPPVWVAPRELLNVEAMPFIPRQGIGRGYKAGKEEIIGLITALRLFVERDHAADRALWESQLQHIVDGLADVPHVQAEYLTAGDFHTGLPYVRIKLDEQALGMDAYEFTRKLAYGDPPIHSSDRELAQGALLINPFCLLPGDAAKIVARIISLIVEDKQQA